MIDQFYMMDLGKANEVISIEIPDILCALEELNAQACCLLPAIEHFFNTIAFDFICIMYVSLYYPSRCRVPYLVDEYSSVGFKVHHFPVPEGNVPTMADCSDIIEQLKRCISFGHRTLLQ